MHTCLVSSIGVKPITPFFVKLNKILKKLHLSQRNLRSGIRSVFYVLKKLKRVLLHNRHIILFNNIRQISKSFWSKEDNGNHGFKIKLKYFQHLWSLNNTRAFLKSLPFEFLSFCLTLSCCLQLLDPLNSTQQVRYSSSTAL